jgi:hypothetical protein
MEMESNITFVSSVDVSNKSTERSDSDDSQPISSTTNSPLTEVEQPRVWMYDHGNRFESERPVQAKVVRMFPNPHEVSYMF